MSKVTHPEDERNLEQAEFLNTLPSGQRRFHELVFSYENAAFRYCQLANDADMSMVDYEEWLGSLPAVLSAARRLKGFEKSRTSQSFKMYVLEKGDVGIKAYIAELMGEAEYADYERVCLKKNG